MTLSVDRAVLLLVSPRFIYAYLASLARVGWSEMDLLSISGISAGIAKGLRLMGLPFHLVFHPSLIHSMTGQFEERESPTCRASSDLVLKVKGHLPHSIGQCKS